MEYGAFFLLWGLGATEIGWEDGREGNEVVRGSEGLLGPFAGGLLEMRGRENPLVRFLSIPLGGSLCSIFSQRALHKKASRSHSTKSFRISKPFSRSEDALNGVLLSSPPPGYIHSPRS